MWQRVLAKGLAIGGCVSLSQRMCIYAALSPSLALFRLIYIISELFGNR